MTDPEQLPQKSEEPEEYIQKTDLDQIGEEGEEFLSLPLIDECREMSDFSEAREGGVKGRRGLHILKVPKMFNPPPPPEEK